MKNNFRKFNEIFSQAICGANVENTNTFIPKVRSTVRPDERLTYNEIHQHIRKQLNK